jgi:hypothetical protein
MSIHDDIEECEEIFLDPYSGKTTTSARAKLCGSCINYLLQNIHMTSVRCKLEIRPKVHFDSSNNSWTASCQSFVQDEPH